MLTFVAIVHILVAILLVVIVLLQDSKGGGAFGMGSSGSGQVLSSTNAANFLVKTTRVLGAVFATTCIALTYLSTQTGKSVIDQVAPPTTSGSVTETLPAADAPAGAGTDQNAQDQ